MFDLVRALNSAIDAGAARRGRRAGVRDAFDALRPRARRAVACAARKTRSRRCRSAEIERLIEDGTRRAARRDFAEADRIRDDLAARGILLEDGAGGTRWKRK